MMLQIFILRLQLFRPFMRPSSVLGYKGRMFKKLVNYNFVGSAGSRYKDGIYIYRVFHDFMS
jgi:hypothetical protein